MASRTVNEGDLEELKAALWPAGEPRRTRVVSCRHCGHPNRVGVAEAALSPERVWCGSCSNALFLGRDEPFTGLRSDAYQHGLDRRSLATLRSIPGVPATIRWMYEQIGDRTAQLSFMSDAIQCSDEQFPELVHVVDRARRRIDFPEMPAVYLGESPYMNAM